MLDAVQLGLSARDFWAMSARAVIELQREDLRRKRARLDYKEQQIEDGKRGRRLSRLPRP